MLICWIVLDGKTPRLGSSKSNILPSFGNDWNLMHIGSLTDQQAEYFLGFTRIHFHENQHQDGMQTRALLNEMTYGISDALEKQNMNHRNWMQNTLMMLAVHGSWVVPLDRRPHCIPFQRFQSPAVIHPMSAIIEKIIFSQNFMHANVKIKQQTDLNNLFQWEP